MSAPIFHIAERRIWEASRETGRYLPEEFEGEGFIHCSEARQVAFVADLLFRGAPRPGGARGR